MSFHNETHVKKTRKTRRCDWCSERIEKGDPSVSTSGICEGDFYQGRYHPECWTAIARYCRKHKAWGEELPDGPMNRGGVEEAGEPEQPTDEGLDETIYCAGPVTYRELHEDAAGMGLDGSFFAVSKIDPNALVKCNCVWNEGHEEHCDIVAANRILISRHAKDQEREASLASDCSNKVE